jgi:hypothetical protein
MMKTASISGTATKLRLNLEAPGKADVVNVKQSAFPAEPPMNEELPTAHFPKPESMLTLSPDNSSKA